MAVTTPPTEQTCPLLAHARHIEQEARWADGPAWQQDRIRAQRLRQQARQPGAGSPDAAAAQQLEQARQARAAMAARLNAIASLGRQAVISLN
jgi:hypothetical protein